MIDVENIACNTQKTYMTLTYPRKAPNNIGITLWNHVLTLSVNPTDNLSPPQQKLALSAKNADIDDDGDDADV